MGGNASGLTQIWHLHSEWLMAALSLIVLAAYAGLTVALALRAFRRSTLH